MRRKWVRALLSGAAISLAATMQTVSASADSLFGAMEKAYVTNPTLNSARAGQRAGKIMLMLAWVAALALAEGQTVRLQPSRLRVFAR